MNPTCKYCPSIVLGKSVCSACEQSIRSIAAGFKASVQPPAMNINGPTINISGPSVNAHGSTINVSGPSVNVHGSTTNISPSITNDQTFNNTGFTEKSNQPSPSHVNLNTEGAGSASSKPSVVVQDGIKYKICNYNGCQTLNPIKNNKLSCTNVKCGRNIRK